ncbi:hypothetical protein Drorol1_Dr00007612 [Drosera rotundifolia]
MISASSFSAACCCLNHAATGSLKIMVSTLDFRNRTTPSITDENWYLHRILVNRERVPSNRIRCSTSGKLSIPEVDQMEKKKKLSYLLRTKNADKSVRVIVEKKNSKHLVHLEVSSAGLTDAVEGALVMSWGIQRSVSSSPIPLDSQSSTQKSKTTTYEAPFVLTAVGTYAAELEFDSHLAPFYLSFVLKHVVGSTGIDEFNHLGRNFCVPVGFGSGFPSPLGSTLSADGSTNFALFSRNAESVVLCLFDDHKSEKPALEIELDPYVNRTGNIWHVSINAQGRYVAYGYQCKGPRVQGREKTSIERFLLDPFAKGIGNSGLGLLQVGELREASGFDWNGDIHPKLPMEELVVYRLNVKNFTKDKSSNLSPEIAGSFSGVQEKIQHLKDLGINAIVLEPVFPFDEKQGPYFPFHFFSPNNFYGKSKSSASAIKSMKEMVKAMHQNGIEVYLEVVFTHSAKAGTLQEIDYSSYFYADGVIDQGAGDALNCNYPTVQQLILDNLRFWVSEFHVDGFCFMNASSLLKGFHGEELSRPPLIEAITFDPMLANTKLIADSWSPHELSSKPVSFPHWKRWAEVNSTFCDDVRNFIRGKGLLSSLATRLCGSGDIFSDGRGPAYSFNFIARNFGLPLVDLVSFSSSVIASELSWNCGEEGPTKKKLVLERRLKQIRNFLLILFVSLGVPVLNMGDECGQSSGGSSAYADRRPLNWNSLSSIFGVQTTQFIAYLISLRKRRSELFQKATFLNQEMISWHGSDLSPPIWDDPTAKFLAMTLKAEPKENQLDGDLFIAFNAAGKSENVLLPTPPEEMEWVRLIDTALPFPGFFSSTGEPVLEQLPGLVTYEVKSYSYVLFEARALPAASA